MGDRTVYRSVRLRQSRLGSTLPPDIAAKQLRYPTARYNGPRQRGAASLSQWCVRSDTMDRSQRFSAGI
eukprot:1392344-Pleurochrysis_carterae.AAC.2